MSGLKEISYHNSCSLINGTLFGNLADWGWTNQVVIFWQDSQRNL